MWNGVSSWQRNVASSCGQTLAVPAAYLLVMPPGLLLPLSMDLRLEQMAAAVTQQQQLRQTQKQSIATALQLLLQLPPAANQQQQQRQHHLHSLTWTTLMPWRLLSRQ